MKRIANNRPKTSDQNGEALIDFLESKLEQDCIDVQEKLDQSKEKYKRAALLMTEFLHDTLS